MASTPEVLQHLSGAGNKQNLPKKSERRDTVTKERPRVSQKPGGRWPLGTCVTGCREGPWDLTELIWVHGGVQVLEDKTQQRRPQV